MIINLKDWVNLVVALPDIGKIVTSSNLVTQRL